MNVEASSSSSGGPHPKRSNSPLLSSSGAPASRRVPTTIRRCPCVTPSTETFVTVVSFMVAVTFPLDRRSVQPDGGADPTSPCWHGWVPLGAVALRPPHASRHRLEAKHRQPLGTTDAVAVQSAHAVDDRSDV